METKTPAQSPVIVEETFNAPALRLWEALTNPDHMKEWYFDIENFRPEIGGEYQFYAGTEEKKWLHALRITEAIPKQKIAYTWKYPGFAGESLVTFEIFDDGNNSRLKLTHEGLETFPSDTSDFARKNFVEGWNEIIHNNLRKFLES